MRFKIGLDVDGVIANFNQSYIDELNLVSGSKVKYDINNLREWNYEVSLGFNKDQVDEVWNKLADPIRGRDFWAGLAPCANSQEFKVIEEWDRDHELTYITSSPDVHRHTRQKWVNAFYGTASPLIVSHLKGHIAAGLGLHAVIDDRPRNLEDVISYCGTKCKVILYDRPWNREPQHPLIIRVGSLVEAFDKLQESVLL
jgi:5'(3')-deoxyribonucleotidase